MPIEHNGNCRSLSQVDKRHLLLADRPQNPGSGFYFNTIACDAHTGPAAPVAGGARGYNLRGKAGGRSRRSPTRSDAAAVSPALLAGRRATCTTN